MQSVVVADQLIQHFLNPEVMMCCNKCQQLELSLVQAIPDDPEGFFFHFDTTRKGG
jgi:hypothetical protein